MNTEFVVASLVVAITPGTGTIYTLSTALSQGWRAGLVAAFGCTLGIVPHLLVSLCGLAWLLERSTLLLDGLKVAGVAYLLYLAWGLWWDRSALTLEDATAMGSRRIIGQAVLLNLFNPKLTVFFLAFMPLFLSQGAASPVLELFGLSVVFMLVTLAVFAGYGLLASTLRARLLQRPAVWIWIRRGFALVFVGMGLSLALSNLR